MVWSAREYARVDDEFKLIEALVRARTAAKLTQAELARRLGTTQSAIDASHPVVEAHGHHDPPSLAKLARGAGRNALRHCG